MRVATWQSSSAEQQRKLLSGAARRASAALTAATPKDPKIAHALAAYLTDTSVADESVSVPGKRECSGL